MKAKLVIWDLDDTLWEGTLAEGDTPVLNDARARIIRTLNERGVVNSICSKNDFAQAQKALQSFGLWEQFVFPSISFTPKGEAVKSIIADMNLRAPDVVFIDDNETNRREVAFANPGITVVDPLTNEADHLLGEIMEAFDGIKRNRVDEYRILEKKRTDRQQTSSNEEFLKTCDIKVCLVRRSDNLPFAGRIEELINRTNQLNFLKTRVPEGSMAEFLINPRHETWSVIVWDKYGFHGLVGFAAIVGGTLQHFAFSCRIMNMGIESSVLAAISSLVKTPPAFELEAVKKPWVTFIDPNTSLGQSKIKSSLGSDKPINVRIMANCQSGAIAHYIGQDGVDWDNYPRIFTLASVFSDKHDYNFLPLTIYGAFNDYNAVYWPNDTLPDADTYKSAAERLTRIIPDTVENFVVILPPEVVKSGPLPTFKQYNDVWRTISSYNPRIRIIEMSEISPALQADARHFSAEALSLCAQRIKSLRPDT